MRCNVCRNKCAEERLGTVQFAGRTTKAEFERVPNSVNKVPRNVPRCPTVRLVDCLLAAIKRIAGKG